MTKVSSIIYRHPSDSTLEERNKVKGRWIRKISSLSSSIIEKNEIKLEFDEIKKNKNMYTMIDQKTKASQLELNWFGSTKL